MIKRTCPNCKTDNYSADSLRDWTCCNCGARIVRTTGIVRPAPTKKPTPAPIRCIGYGEFEGKCENKADRTTSPSGYWCERCEKLRRKTITRQMETLARELREEELAWRREREKRKEG